MKFFNKIFHNKSIVTIVALILCLVILFFAYRYRVDKAIGAVNVPIAVRRLEPREEITEESFKTVKVAQSMLSENVIRQKNELIGKFVNYNTFIPEGSLFYQSAVVTWDQMPDSAWADIEEGYTIVSLKVTAQTTYGNSIYPGDKIDLYYQNRDSEGKLFIGPLIKGIQVLAVKDGDGNHIFKKSAEQQQAEALIFAVPNDMFLLLKRAYYLGSNSIIPVPRNKSYDAKTEADTKYIIDYINNNCKITDEDINDTNNKDITVIE